MAPPGVSENKRVARITLVVVGTLLAVSAVLWLAFNISNVIFMVFVSLFIAIAIEPPVHFLTKRGWKRGVATGVVFLAAILVVAGFFVALGPLLVDQVTSLVEAFPDYVQSVTVWLNQTFGLELSPDLTGLTDQQSQITAWLTGNAGGLVGGIVGVGAALGSFFFFAATVGLFSFYMVAELPQLRRTILSTMPEKQQRDALHVWDVAVEKMGGYIYSRLILAFIGGLIAALFLSFLEIPFAISLGIWIGVLSQFIPVIGTYLAAVLPAIVALSSRGTVTMIWVVVFFVGYQQLENLVISPRITKRTMSIHPAVSIAAIIIGGSLLGPIGIVLALPTTGIIQALISESTKRHEVILDEKEGTEVGDD